MKTIDQYELDCALGQAREVHYIGDCIKIRAALQKAGASIFLRDVERIWKWHSDRQSAGWLFVPDDPEEILDVVQCYISRDE